MKRIAVLIACGGTAIPLMGQTVAYIKTYDMTNYVPPNVSAEGLLAIDTAGSGYYLAGSFVEVMNLFPLTAETASVVLKTDKDGNVVGGSMYKLSGMALTDVKSSLGNYLLSGFTLSSDTSGVIMEMDPTGTVLWAKRLNINMSNSSPDVRDKVIEGIRLSSGDYVFVGESVDDITTGFDALVLKTDGAGNLIWYRFLGGSSSYGDKARDVLELTGGDVAVAGIAGGFIGLYDGFLAVLDGATGNLNWVKVYGTSESEYIFDVEATSDGGFILVGDRFVSTGDTNVLVIKVDGSGDVQWAYEYGDASSKELGRGIVEVADGYVISGSRNSSILLFKIDLSGGVIWAKTYSSPGIDAGSELVRGVDGGFAIVGVWNVGVGQDGVVVKTLDDGGVGSSCSVVSSITLPSSSTTLTVQSPSFTLARTLSLSSHSPSVSPTAIAPGDECPLSADDGLSISEAVPVHRLEDYEIFTVDGRRVGGTARRGIYILKGRGGCTKVIRR